MLFRMDFLKKKARFSYDFLSISILKEGKFSTGNTKQSEECEAVNMTYNIDTGYLQWGRKIKL